MKIVPATPELIREYYGSAPAYTMRAYTVVDDDGHPLSVAGFIRMRRGVMAVFSESKPGAREQHKKTAAKFARMLMKVADDNGWTLIADADCNICNAERFLERLGFQRDENGEYVRWAR